MVATHQHSVDSSTLQQRGFEHARDLLTLAPGQIAGLSGIPGSGLTRIGMSLLAPYAARGPLVYLDVRGWASPMAAWEMGIEPERLVVVRSKDIVTWSRIVATLLDGVRGVYAEVPVGLRDQALYKLAAKARAKRTPLVLRPITGKLPSGIAHLNLEAREVLWEGTEAGHGSLTNRRTLLVASGKATRGMVRTIEVEDDGTNNLRVVPHMGTQTAGPVNGRVRAG
ncbi:MAG: hypothetical protein ACC683_12680 [Acidimicrobiia bacterium]